MSVLVVGGAGYIGSHTVVALHEAGMGPVVVDNFANAHRDQAEALRSLTSADLVVHDCDATQRLGLEQIFDRHRPEAVIHFAAHKSVPESFADPLSYYRNNMGATLALAQAAAEAGVRRFVFSSSAVVYGESAQPPVNEDDAAVPQSPYGRSKLMCEQVLIDAAEASGMQVAMLRYFNPVGAHESGLIGERPLNPGHNLVPTVMSVAAGKLAGLRVYGDDYRTKDGTPVRDFVHVMDLAEGHIAALRAPLRAPPGAPSDAIPGTVSGTIPGNGQWRVFNLGTGIGTTVLELLQAARAQTGQPIPHEIAPRRAGDIEASWADCSRAAAELGWRARRDLPQMLGDHWRFAQAQQRPG